MSLSCWPSALSCSSVFFVDEEQLKSSQLLAVRYFKAALRDSGDYSIGLAECLEILGHVHLHLSPQVQLSSCSCNAPTL